MTTEDSHTAAHVAAACAKPTVQYRVAFGKKDEAVDGPDDAGLVVTVGSADCAMDPTLAFMTGKLKSSGPTGALFDVLKSGEAAAALRRLAVR